MALELIGTTLEYLCVIENIEEELDGREEQIEISWPTDKIDRPGTYYITANFKYGEGKLVAFGSLHIYKDGAIKHEKLSEENILGGSSTIIVKEGTPQEELKKILEGLVEEAQQVFDKEIYPKYERLVNLEKLTQTA